MIEGNVGVGLETPSDKFECVSQITGDMNFSDGGWSKEQFASLRRVTGTLYVYHLACNLAFLPCLESVGSLVIGSTDECFRDFGGLDKLNEIRTLFQVKDAPGLRSLAGLEKVMIGPANVELSQLPAMTSLGGLTLPSSVKSVTLLDLPQVADLSLLASVETIGTLSLSRLPAVPSLADLANLKSAGHLELGKCPGIGPVGLDAIQSLAGLDSLASVDVLEIAANNALTTLDGAPLLTQMNEVVIVENDLLPEAAITAFLTQNTNPGAVTCFGDSNACTCP